MEYIQIILFLVVVALAIFFIYYQQKTLELIRLENREMNPSGVWWQLIPIIGMVWQFIVVKKISVSIYNELNAPIDDSIVNVQPGVSDNPAYYIGLSYCILICLGIVPFPFPLKSIFSLAGLLCWIIYWVQLARYRKELRTRALVQSI